MAAGHGTNPLRILPLRIRGGAPPPTFQCTPAAQGAAPPEKGDLCLEGRRPVSEAHCRLSPPVHLCQSVQSRGALHYYIRAGPHRVSHARGARKPRTTTGLPSQPKPGRCMGPPCVAAVSTTDRCRGTTTAQATGGVSARRARSAGTARAQRPMVHELARIYPENHPLPTSTGQRRPQGRNSGF